MKEGVKVRTEQLTYFIETDKTKSINKASEKLHINHQSLNIALTNMETELGCKLFERSYQGVVLTEAGIAVLSEAKKMLHAYQQMLDIGENQVLQDDSEVELSGKLSIYSAPFMGLAFTDIVVKDFLTTYPKVDLAVKSKESWDILDELEDDAGDLNFYVTFNQENFDKKYNHQLFTAHHLLCDKLYLVISNKHALYGKQKSISISTVSKYQLALYQANRNTPNPVFDLFSPKKKPNIGFVTDHLQAFIGMLELGNHCALIPYASITNNSVFRDNKKFTFLPVTNANVVYFGYLAKNKNNPETKVLMDAFIDALRNCF